MVLNDIYINVCFNIASMKRLTNFTNFLKAADVLKLNPIGGKDLESRSCRHKRVSDSR
jgi:hypothetical protein